MKLITTCQEAFDYYDTYFKNKPTALPYEWVVKARYLHEIFGDEILPGLLERINKNVPKKPATEFKALSGEGFLDVIIDQADYNNIQLNKISDIYY